MANTAKGDEEDMDIAEEAAQLAEHRQYGRGTLTEKDLDEKYVQYHIVSGGLLTVNLKIPGPATQSLSDSAISRSLSDTVQSS